MAERVFDGLKVIDCASFIAGPAAATVMSDFGAEVIKIEPPGAGDPYRRRATPPLGPGLASNPGFVLDGRNKKSLALDLRAPAGQDVLRRLVAQVSKPLRWDSCMATLDALAVTATVELPPAGTLSALIKRDFKSRDRTGTVILALRAPEDLDKVTDLLCAYSETAYSETAHSGSQA